MRLDSAVMVVVSVIVDGLIAFVKAFGQLDSGVVGVIPNERSVTVAVSVTVVIGRALFVDWLRSKLGLLRL